MLSKLIFSWVTRKFQNNLLHLSNWASAKKIRSYYCHTFKIVINITWAHVRPVSYWRTCLNFWALSELWHSDHDTMTRASCNAKPLCVIQLNYIKVSTHKSCETVRTWEIFDYQATPKNPSPLRPTMVDLQCHKFWTGSCF